MANNAHVSGLAAPPRWWGGSIARCQARRAARSRERGNAIEKNRHCPMDERVLVIATKPARA
jgi:hypothetical protein